MQSKTNTKIMTFKVLGQANGLLSADMAFEEVFMFQCFAIYLEHAHTML